MTDSDAREEQLRTRLAELMGRLHRIDDHLQEPPEKDWEDNAIEAEMDEVLEGLGHAGKTEVQAIKPLFSASRVEPTAHVCGVERTSQRNA